MGAPGDGPSSAGEIFIAPRDLVEAHRRALHNSLSGGVSAASLEDWEVTAFRYAAGG
jgi:hypothetical protein